MGAHGRVQSGIAKGSEVQASGTKQHSAIPTGPALE